MNNDLILITEKDLLRLKNILGKLDGDDFENLELELDRAKIISDNEVPPDLVTMNSKVRYLNINDNKEMTISIVYPSEADLDKNKISVLAPLGSALLGLRKGQKINWKFPDGKTKTLEILEVIYQPEANQDWHL